MLSDLITKSAKWAFEKPAPFLRYTTAAIYLISTLAQGGGIVLNKDIPKGNLYINIFKKLPKIKPTIKAIL